MQISPYIYRVRERGRTRERDRERARERWWVIETTAGVELEISGKHKQSKQKIQITNHND